MKDVSKVKGAEVERTSGVVVAKVEGTRLEGAEVKGAEEEGATEVEGAEVKASEVEARAEGAEIWCLTIQ